MSKLMDGYIAKFLTADITAPNKMAGYSKYLGKKGQLTIWESEKLHPGQYYIRFKTLSSDAEIHTSCGRINVSNNKLKIATHEGANIYTFQLLEHVQTIDFRLKLPERYLHVCDHCGKREILSSKEAFDQGWDYPGPDGIYKDAPNFGFGMLLPRTCGNCSIADSFCWKVVNGGEGKKDTETDQAFKEMLERVKNEPWSLVVSEDE